MQGVLRKLGGWNVFEDRETPGTTKCGKCRSEFCDKIMLEGKYKCRSVISRVRVSIILIKPS